MDKLVIKDSDIETYINYIINNSNDFRIQDLGLMTEKFRSFFKKNCEILSPEKYNEISGQFVKNPVKVYMIDTSLLNKYVDLCGLEISRLVLKKSRENRMIDYVLSQNGEVLIVPIGKGKEYLIDQFTNYLNIIKNTGKEINHEEKTYDDDAQSGKFPDSDPPPAV